MAKTTRMLTAGLVAMIVIGANRPAAAQNSTTMVPVQNDTHVADEGVLALGGIAPAGRGPGGTIGAATKYHAPQITDTDVVLGEDAAQEFLQSDTFARLLKDPASLTLLSDAHVVPLLNEPALASALQNADVAAALRPFYGGGCRNCMTAFLAALQNPSFAKALQNSQFLAAAQSPALAAALNNPDRAAALRPLGFGGGCKTCMTALFAALQHPSFARALQNPHVVAALQNPAFAKALSDPRLGAALQSPAFQQALNSAGFFAALRDARFAQGVARSL
jgi:hypothetical protein